MTKHIVDKHQELLDEFAKAVLPMVYEEMMKLPLDEKWKECLAIDSYRIAQAMVNERSRLIQLRRECEYKQRMNIADCSSCPERSSCNK